MTLSEIFVGIGQFLAIIFAEPMFVAIFIALIVIALVRAIT